MSAGIKAALPAVQVLGNPQARAAYDLQLAAHHQASGDVAIADEVQLTGMTAAQTGSGVDHVLPCRCGGSFVAAASDLHSLQGSLVLPCDSCSLHLLVHLP